MFKRIQISSLGIKGALILSAHLSMGLDASDPCSGRKFCGNFTIIFNGAGENLSPDPEKKGKDPNAHATAQFLNKYARPKDNNTRVLLLSSDSSEEVVDAVSKAKDRLGDNFAHIPTSKPSFESFLKSDATLEQIKNAFAKDPECDRLMKLNPGSDISKFIKTHVFVASHSHSPNGGFKGLPVWPNVFDTGEDDYYAELASADVNSSVPKTFVQSSDFDQFRNAFSGSVIQTAALTCDGVDVANMVTPVNSDSCSCFMGFTDSGVTHVGDTAEKKGVVDFALSANSNSLLTFSNPTFSYYRWYLMGDGPKGMGNNFASPIFTIETKKENHFDLFALTSADVLAADIVATTPPPQMLANAKVKLVSHTSDKEFEVAFREVEALAKKAKEKNDEYLATLGKDPASLKRSRESAKDFYNTCLNNPNSPERLCVEFKKLVDTIDASKAQDADFSNAMTWLEQVRKDLSEMAKSPIMDGKNNDPVKFLAVYRKYAENFDDFRTALTRAARKLGRADELVAPLKQMSTQWATYHSAYINAYFPDVVGDTLDRRVANYKKAADALKAKFVETGDAKYKKKLERLRAQLACVLNFPLGPDYKESNEFPVGRLIVDSSNSGSNGVPLEVHTEDKNDKSSSSQRPALR